VTDTPGWASPTDPPEGARPPQTTPPQPAPQWPRPHQPPPPGYGAPAPDAPHGYAPAGTFGQPGYGQGQPGYGPQAGYGQPQAWAGQWGREAPAPGIIPLRPLGLGEILDGGFAIVRQHPRVTLGLSAVVVAITQLLVFGIQLSESLEGGRIDPDAFGGFTWARLAGFAVSSMGLLILAGLLTVVMGEAVLGRTPTISQAWQKTRPKFWTLVGAGFLGSFVPVIGLFLCIVPGAFLFGAWAFMTPVVVLERAGVAESIRRSWRLAVPDFWRVWGIRVLATLIAALIQFVITLPFLVVFLRAVLSAERGDTVSVVPLALMTLGGIVASTITAPFTAGVISLLYIDRRMRVEGLDVTLARSVTETPGQPA